VVSHDCSRHDVGRLEARLRRGSDRCRVRVNQLRLIGVGTMGHGMATSALRAGIPTIVLGPAQPAADPKSRRARRGSRGEARRTRLGEAAIVVTMVPDADGPSSRLRSTEGMLAALAPGSIWVQMSRSAWRESSTSPPSSSKGGPTSHLSTRPSRASKDPAEHGELTIFASGPDGAVRARLTPLFDALGHQTLWVGPVGTGTRVKVVNNTWLAFGAEAVDASVALAHRLGLDTKTMMDALEAGPLVSPWQSAKLQRIVSGDFSAQFALRLALKDVLLALDAAGDGRFDALRVVGRRVATSRRGRPRDEDLTVVTQVLEMQGDAR